VRRSGKGGIARGRRLEGVRSGGGALEASSGPKRTWGHDAIGYGPNDFSVKGPIEKGVVEKLSKMSPAGKARRKGG